MGPATSRIRCCRRWPAGWCSVWTSPSRSSGCATRPRYRRPTRGRNANALQHAFSTIGRDLDRARRADLASRIETYRRGEDPLSVAVTLLAHYASDGTPPWLAGQTYLRPFPATLRLRHNLP